MRRPLIFISHASTEKDRAKKVAELLKAAGIEAMHDAADLRPGASFVNFMENALCRADYCLLLWSREAARQHFVRTEWEAAFAREQECRRVFLVVARLDDHPPPRLLRPRLYVDLFPSLEKGVEQLVRLWRDDARTTDALGRLVLPPTSPAGSGGTPAGSVAGAVAEVYVTSELFDCVLPLPADLNAPAGVLLEETVARLRLPRRLAVNDRLGLDLTYRLLREDGRTLARTQSSREQGVAARSVLFLEVTVEEFATVPATSGPPPGRRTYRHGAPAARYAEVLAAALAEVGLRSTSAPALSVEEAARP
jgi:hypothetical protein